MAQAFAVNEGPHRSVTDGDAAPGEFRHKRPERDMRFARDAIEELSPLSC